MSLLELQRLYADLTLGRVTLDAIRGMKTSLDAAALDYEFTKKEVALLQAIDFDAAEIGLAAHRGINTIIRSVRYVGDPASPGRLGISYPFDTPALKEDDMTDPRDPQYGHLSEQAHYPPQQGDAYNPAAVRCAPAVDPSIYNPAAVRCAPAVDPSIYNPAAVRCAPAVDPSIYNPAAVRCAPAIDPAMLYQAMASLAATQRKATADIRLRGAILKGADMSDLDLRDSDLTGADLSDCNLEGTDLRGAILDGANLAGANLKNVRWK